MLMASCYLSYPFLFINKYVYSKLTKRPFVWLPTYTADVLTLACFIYAFGWHVVFLNEDNPGLWLEKSKNMMYVHAYSFHVTEFEINIQFYVGAWLLIAFIRQLLGLTVTRQLGPIISTIIVMFKDVARFILIWVFVLLGYSSVGFITFQEVPDLNKFEDSLKYFF